MKTRTLSILILSFIFVIVSGMSVLKLGIIKRTEGHQYVTSSYSKYCYPNRQENKNIKTKIYYSSLETCGKPLKS